MIDTRLLNDQCNQIHNELDKVCLNANIDPILADFHLQKASMQIAHMRREIYMANHRSGEVK